MIYSEIEYIDSNDNSIHSDLVSEGITDEYRNLLHLALDEWLNKSNETGSFYVKGDKK